MKKRKQLVQLVDKEEEPLSKKHKNIVWVTLPETWKLEDPECPHRREKFELDIVDLIGAGYNANAYSSCLVKENKRSCGYATKVQTLETYDGDTRTREERFEDECAALEVAAGLQMAPKLIDRWVCRAKRIPGQLPTIIVGVSLGIIVMELVAHDKWKNIPAPEYAEMLVHDVRKLHKAGWTHGDLQAPNLLLAKDHKHFWFIDFGNSNRIDALDRKYDVGAIVRQFGKTQKVWEYAIVQHWVDAKEQLTVAEIHDIESLYWTCMEPRRFFDRFQPEVEEIKTKIASAGKSPPMSKRKHSDEDEEERASKRSKKMVVWVTLPDGWELKDADCLHRRQQFELELVDFIGMGSYGMVYSSCLTDIKSGQQENKRRCGYATKVQTLEFYARDPPPSQEQRFADECAAMDIASELKIAPKVIDHWTCPAKRVVVSSEDVDNKVQATRLPTEISVGVIVMELIEHDRWQATKAMPFPEYADMLVRDVRRLHKAGWTHGDLRDQNLLIAIDHKRIWIIDFGRAERIRALEHKYAVGQIMSQSGGTQQIWQYAVKHEWFAEKDQLTLAEIHDIEAIYWTCMDPKQWLFRFQPTAKKIKT